MDKETLEKIEKLINKIDNLKDDKDNNKENMEKAKEVIIKQLEKPGDCLLFANEKGSLVTGTFAEILSLIAMTIDKLKNDGIDKEGLIEAFLLGITDKKNKEKLDYETADLILEAMKEHTK